MWFQPLASSRYVNVPRYTGGEEIQSYSQGLGSTSASWSVQSKCLKVKLAGATELLAGAAIAVGVLSLM